MHILQDANTTEVKKAFRSLSLKWHPDKNKQPGAKKHFQLLSKAYEVMMNQTHRELYDHLKENPSVSRDMYVFRKRMKEGPGAAFVICRPAWMTYILILITQI